MESEVNGKKRRQNGESHSHQSKRSRGDESFCDTTHASKPGKIKRILVRNFMCHDALEVALNPNVNFIVGRNGSGKSAILTALTVGLGARANVTSRGASVKGFIKKGKHVATIEITLLNNGPMAYKPDIYGESITVYRTIGNTSSYKIKNWKGDVISTKRNELDNILRAMNIQIDNPISILNQDISRTFLVSSKPDEKYELFMKATLLDIIGDNYKEAELTCQQEYEKFKQYNEIVSEGKKEVEQLKKDIKRAESIDIYRKEIKQLEDELCWAIVISEETKLHKVEEVYKKCDDNLKHIQDTESTVGSKDEELNKKIRQLEEEIKSAEQDVSQSSEIYNKMKQEYDVKKEEHSTKAREWRSVQSKVKRIEEDINMIRKEIQRLESGDVAEQNERKKMKDRLTDCEQKLDNIDKFLKTAQNTQMHLETDKMRLIKDMQAAKIEVNSCENRIKTIGRELSALKQQSGNALTVFGRNVPRLLRRIEEEYNNGQFRKKPRGPLGAYITVKDSTWTAAIENYLGAGTFSTFCVDNSQDAKVLNVIIREIFLNERPPNIICSRFYEKVHDVRNHCTRAPGYSNLLDAMDISDPVVANCLIDQREVECVLLIPTSKEASEIMSNESRVPRHCKRAFTKQGDTFYPDPHYRSYGGPRNMRAKFLQVSTTDAINALEEELRAANNDKHVAMNSYTAACEKEKRTNSELVSVNADVAKYRSDHRKYKEIINDLKDKIESNEAISVTVFRNELTELEKKMAQEKSAETRLHENVLELQKTVENLEAQVKRYRELRQNLDTKINPLKEHIKELHDEKEALRASARHAARKLEAVRQALQNATAELETQQRVTEQAISNATNQCERLTTERSINELERLSRDLKGKIREIERQFGTIEQLRVELKEKEAKFGKDARLASKIEESYQVHFKRLSNRKKIFSDMKNEYGIRIQKSFSDVLALRNKKGTISIDHARKVLELEINSQNDSKRPTNDARSLSGGERSYSTVAFILALWDCTNLPFYFLDEFDVFMDKVNRRVIMDILLDHTRTHPQSQFTFLTPLDTSNVLAEDYVTIHQLEAPERASQEQ